jgi:hypothetical protein
VRELTPLGCLVLEAAVHETIERLLHFDPHEVIAEAREQARRGCLTLRETDDVLEGEITPLGEIALRADAATLPVRGIGV